jgi:hypothetical protein
MEKNHFLQLTKYHRRKNILTLKTPFLFNLPQSVTRKLMLEYNPNREIGGVLFVEPICIIKQKVLVIRKVKILRNISDQPQRQYSAGTKLTEVMDEALKGNKDGLRFFPIFFHSHPQHQNGGDPYHIINEFIALETSDADKKLVSYVLSYETLGISLRLPHALICKTDSELFIGFYGGSIAPNDFREYMEKLTGKTVAEINSIILNWAKEGKKWWKIALAIAGAFLTSLSYAVASSYPPALYAAVMEILRKRTPDQQQTYFTLTNGKEVNVYIP